MSASIEDFDFSVDILSALLWRHNQAGSLQAILQAKQDWYAANHTQFWEDWVTNVFNLDTANEFGLSVWAQILGVPLNLIVAPNAGPQWGFGSMAYNTPYNIAPVSDQPVTSATLSSLRRAGGWRGDRAMYSTARTNLALQSQAFDNASWSKLGTATVTANTGVAPDGTVTADTLNLPASGDRVNLAAISVTGGSTVTHSVWLAGSGTVYVALASNGGTFISAGTLVNLTPALTRYSVTMTTNANNTGVFPIIGRYNGAIGGGTATAVQAWGAQLETGAVATPYIPTTTAAVSVTDYTLASNGVLTFATAPGDPAADNIYGSGTYVNAVSTPVTFTNRSIARALTVNNRVNFNNGNFGTSQAGVGLTLDQKRILLKLRYYKLISRCTVPEMNERLKAILGQYGSVYVLDGNNMQYVTFVFGFTPNSALQFILENFDVLPRPAAVGVKYIVSTRPAFGFGSSNQNFNNGTFWAEN